ncbi:hypothetical protein KC19_6G193600 [Ceratodon purpureus]|uniref:Uncharacterized protein n=1 Tax=Ceratodon purpureus TaxID=3225 RepID=A0A8T0HJA2_CERPU|nr:hypothetical protein KC19_6G193600 [Ceratodon purpureus]
MGFLHLQKQESLDSQTSRSSLEETSTSYRYSKERCASNSQGAHKCLAILHGQGDLNVTALALSRGFLYAGSDHGEIRAWGHPAMQEGTKFGGGEGAVKCLVVVGNKVISAHQDHKIRVWRPSKSHPQEHRLVKILPSKDLIPNLVPTKSFSPVRQQHQSLWNGDHRDSISSLAVGNGVLYSGSWDKSIKVWRLSDFRCVESLDEHMDAVNALAVDKHNDLLYSGSGDTTIKVFQKLPDSPDDKHPLPRHALVATLNAKSPVNALALSADGSFLYSGQSDRTVTVWKMGSNEDGKREWSTVGFLRGHRLSVLCLRAFGNGLVVSGSADKTIRVWRRGEDGAHSCVAVMAGHSGPVKSLWVLSDMAMGAMVYSGSMDGDVRIWWLPEDERDCLSSDEGFSDGPVVLNWRSD